jgi:thioredoxin reductase (NADPH)
MPHRRIRDPSDDGGGGEIREKVRVAIIGAGPAGAAAAIFLKRAGFEPLLLEERLPGGLLHEANLVENYPGFPEGISGGELASRIKAQLDRLGVRALKERVVSVKAVDRSFEIDTEDGAEFASNALVIATGTTSKKTDIPGADDIEGEKLFYGVSSLGRAQVDGKHVAILGGGDAALDYAINLSDKGGVVAIISRAPLSSLPLLADRARARGVSVATGCTVTGFTEADDGVVVACECSEGKRDFVCDLVVVAHGREPRLEIIDPQLKNRMDATSPPGTGVPGLFMAGDVVRGINRQAAIAAGDGVLAAMLVQRLLSGRGEDG